MLYDWNFISALAASTEAPITEKLNVQRVQHSEFIKDMAKGMWL
jgi:hypothetical protein